MGVARVNSVQLALWHIRLFTLQSDGMKRLDEVALSIISESWRLVMSRNYSAVDGVQ
jgi:hypothetical protein